jgi:glycosyltransferase involved in cell wall biosynthesis
VESDAQLLQPQFAIIIPACNEEECIGRVLDELAATVPSRNFVIVVGVNGSSDKTAEIARTRPVLVAETKDRGYGYGCQSAIDLVSDLLPSVRAYIFVAGDGATDPRDIGKLVTAYEQGYAFVLGARTGRLSNWPVMKLSHVIANFGLAVWCALLAGRWFKDLAPLRLIDRELFEAIAPQEKTFGWTIEPQIAAARLGAAICEVPARERPRLAGRQKVSGVTWRRTFLVGCRIVAAGFRARLRFRRRRGGVSRTAKELASSPGS